MTRHLLPLLPAIAMCAAIAPVSAARTDEYKVIVHPSNPTAALDRRFLRDVYLRKATDWSTGGDIRPIDLASRFPAHERFLQEVLGKTPSQLRSYWNQQIFSGKAVPPPEADSAASAVAYVLANPGAVAYLPADADPAGTKVVRIK
jgi:ABC-type phosphate transport system substrate-binding protein